MSRLVRDRSVVNMKTQLLSLDTDFIFQVLSNCCFNNYFNTPLLTSSHTWVSFPLLRCFLLVGHATCCSPVFSSTPSLTTEFLRSYFYIILSTAFDVDENVVGFMSPRGLKCTWWWYSWVNWVIFPGRSRLFLQMFTTFRDKFLSWIHIVQGKVIFELSLF